MSTKPFNPFSSIVDAEPAHNEAEPSIASQQASQSFAGDKSESLTNSNVLVGVCSRCAQPMGQARVSEPPDLVYYCAKCRITTPMPDAECKAWEQSMRTGSAEVAPAPKLPIVNPQLQMPQFGNRRPY